MLSMLNSTTHLSFMIALRRFLPRA